MPSLPRRLAPGCTAQATALPRLQSLTAGLAHIERPTASLLPRTAIVALHAGCERRGSRRRGQRRPRSTARARAPVRACLPSSPGGPGAGTPAKRQQRFGRFVDRFHKARCAIWRLDQEVVGDPFQIGRRSLSPTKVHQRPVSWSVDFFARRAPTASWVRV